jgi:hypothetical protein
MVEVTINYYLYRPLFDRMMCKLSSNPADILLQCGSIRIKGMLIRNNLLVWALRIGPLQIINIIFRVDLFVELTKLFQLLN